MHSPFYEEIFELIPSTKVSIEEALSYLVIPFAYYNKKDNSYTNVITSLSDISSYMTSYIVNNIFDDLWGEYTPEYKEISYAYNIIDFHNKIKKW